MEVYCKEHGGNKRGRKDSNNSKPGTSGNISPDTSFEYLSTEEATRENTMAEVMKKLHSKHYNITKDKEPLIFGKCKLLFEKDYVCEVVNNCNYSVNYPIGIIVPVSRKKDIKGFGPSVDFDAALYTKLVKGGPEARLRSRFVVPAILFDNKFICRCGTLTVKLSAVYETAIKSAPPTTTYEEDASGSVRGVLDLAWSIAHFAVSSLTKIIDWKYMDSLFDNDFKILKHLKVERICDLMVEYRKLYGHTVCVSSTEKAHEELYKGLKMEEMPFPGCEFFTTYSEKGRNAEDLFFDWNQVDVTRGLKLTENVEELYLKFNVGNFKKWSLIKLTQNYLKIMLSYAVTGTGGMVVHCISGWDRTPLFISLLRLSLWADGLIHENLDSKEMAYLTVAYDWFLFGHNLPNRLQKGEEVMHFCFNFLQNITSDEFSMTRYFEALPAEKKRKRAFPEFVPGRRMVLSDIRDLVLDHYEIARDSKTSEESQV